MSEGLELLEQLKAYESIDQSYLKLHEQGLGKHYEQQTEIEKLKKQVEILEKALEYICEYISDYLKNTDSLAYLTLKATAKQALEEARNLGLVNFDKKDANQINTTS